MVNSRQGFLSANYAYVLNRRSSLPQTKETVLGTTASWGYGRETNDGGRIGTNGSGSERGSFPEFGLGFGLSELLEQWLDVLEPLRQHDIAAPQVVLDDVVVLEPRQVVVNQ